MTGTISISTDRLLEVIMAHSAAAVLDGLRPRSIGTGDRALVAVLADKEINALAAALPHIIRDINCEDNIWQLSVEIRDTTPLRALRRNFETAVCCGILAHLWPGSVGEVYAADRATLLDTFQSLSPFPGRIERA